jgi:hypothetical protein
MSNEIHVDIYLTTNDYESIDAFVEAIHDAQAEVAKEGGEVNNFYIDSDYDLAIQYVRPENAEEQAKREAVEAAARAHAAGLVERKRERQVAALRKEASRLGFKVVE